MKFERISIKAAVLWEISVIIIAAILLVLVLVIFAPYTWLWYLLLWLLGAAVVFFTFFYIPIAYLNIEYCIFNKTIIYKKGVFFKSTQLLSMNKVSFATIYNNPLTPLLKVSTLVISAPGGNLRILFINSDRAREIADIFKR